MSRSDRNFLVVMLIAFIAMIVVPYWVAWSNGSEGRVFGGFLQNPIDGNSYLAKMRQGYEGEWLFTLPYTSDPGAGTPINFYYLLLGHIARVFSAPLILVFHFARVAGALALGLALYRFFRNAFARNWHLPFVLALFGSGLGWLAVLFGLFTSDFWVAEAYPFLASYTNAHFPIGMALQVWLLAPLTQKEFNLKQSAATILAAAMLAVIFGFGWVIVFVILSAWLLWLVWRREILRLEMYRWFCVVLGGGPIALYQWWVIQNHSVLAQWNAQNLTLAPNIVDLFISLSPALTFAILGIVLLSRSKDRITQFLAIWLIVGIVVVYLPFNLQRRLISGLYVPVAGLAGFAIQTYSATASRRKAILVGIFASLGAPTTWLILAGGFQAANSQPPAIYLYESEQAAFDWLNENAAPDTLVLAAPDSGLLIPAYSHAGVIYGHPFETINAEDRRELVEDFYNGVVQDSLQGVDYVLFGPREMSLGVLPEMPGWHIVFEAGSVQIWAPNS